MSTVKKRKEAAEKKAKEAAEAAKEEAETSWFDRATPMGDYLPKLEGMNYYELLNEGEMKTGKFEDRETQNVEFEAIYHATSNIRGKPHPDSPEEPIEAILSIPLSAARKIRVEMEKNELETPDLIGMILALQRTGEDKKTRYPSVELIASKEYFE